MIAKLKDKISLVTSETHKKYITQKLNKDIAEFRPDIVHRCLLTLQDSPLNKAGLLKVFIHTMDNVLIEVDPSCRVACADQIPRTERKFYQLMAQLLEKLKIRAINSSKTLLRVIKNPITNHLPADCLKVGWSQVR
jgi:rRNA small subunit pseudouridine methyltransferase Nep1